MSKFLPAIIHNRAPAGEAPPSSVTVGSLAGDATSPADCASCGGLGLEPGWDEYGDRIWVDCHRCGGSGVQS